MSAPPKPTGNALDGGDSLGLHSASTIPEPVSCALQAASSTRFDNTIAHTAAAAAATTTAAAAITAGQHGFGCSSSIPATSAAANLSSLSSSPLPPLPLPPSRSPPLSSPASQPLRSGSTHKRGMSWLRRPTLHVDARDQDACDTAANDSVAISSAPRQSLQGRLQDRLIVVVFGLPARGKTFISTKVGRYLNWVGIRTRVFSYTAYRRAEHGPYQEPDFFDYTKPHNVAMRLATSRRCLDDMFAFFYGGGQLAVFNAHNVARSERALVTDAIRSHEDRVECKVLWVEAICDDPNLIERNIMAIERHVTDVGGRSLEQVADDYRARIRLYEAAYEPLRDASCSYIRYYSPGHKVVGTNIEGYVQAKVMSFLSNVRMKRYPLLISRHGESVANVRGEIGGDSPLSALGHEYGAALGHFVAERAGCLPRLKVWSSTLQRAVQTAAYVGAACVERTQWPALGELDSGAFQGITYAEIRANHADEYAARAADKLRYRYPGGESYLDVMRRLEPIIYELERADGPVLLVSHKALLRCLCGYFFGTRLAEIPAMEFPPHAVVELKPHPYGFEATRYELGVGHAELDAAAADAPPPAAPADNDDD